jgi:hypothetical protein
LAFKCTSIWRFLLIIISRLNNFEEFNPYATLYYYKDKPVKLKGIIAAYTENHTKHIHNTYIQNITSLIVKVAGTYNYHYSSKG